MAADRSQKLRNFSALPVLAGIMQPKAPIDQPPRFEFRCWLNDAKDMLGDFREYFEDLGVEERIDTYLLSRRKPALLPKFRGGEIFEIKRRLDVSGNYELWEVAAQESFPLSRDKVACLLDILGQRRLEASPLPDSHAAIELLAPYFKAYCVPKMRRSFERDGCRAEITHVLISLQPFETIAFESEDLNAIADNVERFHLSVFDNKNYGAKLREIAVSS